MIKTREYCIDLPPLSMKRPRLARGHTYYPQAKEKMAYGLIIKQQNKDGILECPIALSLSFFMPIRKSYPRKKLLEISSNNMIHSIKPDIDNLCAFVLNCMTGVIYKDDAQIYELKASKRFDDNPRIEVAISWEEGV